MKRFFTKAAAALAATDKKSAERLAQASTHWLRHTHGSHAVASGTPIEIVQNNLGHASLSTTTIYVTSERKRRYREMEKFWEVQGESKAGRVGASALSPWSLVKGER